MKYANILFISLVLSIIAGCKNDLSANNSKDAIENLQKTQLPIVEKIKQTVQASTYQPESSKTKKPYYGVWTVNKVLQYDRVSSISDEEIKQLIGQELNCSADEISFGSNDCKSPFYKESVVSADDFFENGYVKLSDIGIKQNTIIMVEVFSQKKVDYKHYWYNFGGQFYIKNQDTIIVHYKGVLFELTRNR